MTQTRKLAAIMFTDIVGYTALMSKDEALALEVLDRNRTILKPLIEESHGEWLKEIGDGTLSSFASAVEAVQCAIRIQAALEGDPNLRLRIGIPIGDVVFRDGDVFGDGVNVASRLEPLAEAGGICISERVYADIRNHAHILTKHMGPRTLKGVGDPVDVYAVLTAEPEAGQRAKPAPDPAGAIPTIAVLPFVNMSADPENEYFCDGMSEELIDGLAKVSGLRVVARTSAFAFKGQTPDIREVGRQLNVGSVLEGSVRKSGTKLRITVQLINVADGYHLWSEKYDRELEDIFAIQDEIARTVVEILKVRLVGDQKTQLVKQSTDNMDAYTCFLKASFEWNKQTPDGFAAGMEYYLQAVEFDPTFALAYANLAVAFVDLGVFGAMHPHEARSKAKAAALRAIEINPDVAEGHGALAAVAFFYDWDWKLAKQEFELALALKPHSAVAHLHYAQYKVLLQMNASAEQLLDAALALDPLAPPVKTYHGFFLGWLGQYEKGIAELEEVVESDPNFHFGHHILGILYGLTGHLEKALAQHELARALADLPAAQMMHAHALGLAGQKDAALALIQGLEQGAAQGQAWGFYVGVAYMGLGENEKALDWLEKGFEERNPLLPFISLGKLSEPILDHPRYKALLEKLVLKPVLF